MSEATHHVGPVGVPGDVHKVFPKPGGQYDPYGHTGTPVPLPPHHGQAANPAHNHYVVPHVHHGTQPVPYSVVVGLPVSGRPLIGVSTDARINITGPEGLIAAGCVLIALCITLVSATPNYLPHSLAILAPLIVFGIVLIGLGIFFKTREKPKTPRDEKPKLEGETKGDGEKEKQN